MPWQLIYTSAPRGLLSGQSGFCTVARSADLREALAQRLEQISSYHYLRVAEAATANRNPTIAAFRLLDLRGAKYYVLTRIQPCGLDFTARTNHLAHHLVLQPDELAKLPSPAAILRHWPHWRASWQGEPRLLEEVDAASFAAVGKNFLPAQTWARLTGDGGRAAGLLESECVRGCYLLCPPGSEEQVLQMYCETLQLLNFNGQFPLRPWRHPFTSFLQAEDNPNDFQWRACQEDTPAYKLALSHSAPMMALRSVRVPGNSLVKLAREEPKPPPASKPPPADPAPKSALKTMPREPFTRGLPAPAPVVVKIKKPDRREKPPLLDLKFSINSATLARFGIPAAVLLVLLMVRYHSDIPLLMKHHPASPPVERGSAASTPTAIPLAKSKAPFRESIMMAAAPEATPLECLAGDGPTYVLMVPNLTNFVLPIDSISPFQNLLHRYDKWEPGALPNDIRLEVAADRWAFSAGSRMEVEGRTAPRFAASLGAASCVFDYSDWLDGKGSSLAVQDNFGNVTQAFSMHFGFFSPSNGDPFRLLIVNENHPPAPLHLSRELVQNNRQDVGAALAGPVRDCLLPNFKLLAGRQWQLQPYLQPKAGPAQYLYKGWPPGSVPVFGCELDFTNIAQRLQAQRQDLKNRIENLSQPLGLRLANLLEMTNANLDSFRAFSRGDLTRSRFLDYLKELKNAAPTNSWIRKWHDRFDSDQPDEVSDKLQRLFELWIDQRPQDQARLTATNASGLTNYFFSAWQSLGEAESLQEQLGHVQTRLNNLEHVAYVGLFIVDRRQPGPGVEMIRFEGTP
jgi:hypothetical protein